MECGQIGSNAESPDTDLADLDFETDLSSAENCSSAEHIAELLQLHIRDGSLPLPNHHRTGSELSAISLDSDGASSSGISSPSKNRYLYPPIDTVESLRPEQVRWFYKEENDKKWTPFIGYDSLRIECKYREVRHRQDCQKLLEDKDFNADQNDEHDHERIVVRGSLFEVDVIDRRCYPIYWTLPG